MFCEVIAAILRTGCTGQRTPMNCQERTLASESSRFYNRKSWEMEDINLKTIEKIQVHETIIYQCYGSKSHGHLTVRAVRRKASNLLAASSEEMLGAWYKNKMKTRLGIQQTFISRFLEFQGVIVKCRHNFCFNQYHLPSAPYM